MKRSTIISCTLILTVVVLLPFFLSAIIEDTIIDFGGYEKRIFKEYGQMKTNQAAFKKDGSPNLMLNPTIMALSNWKVVVKSSAIRTKNIVLSMCKKVYSRLHKQDVLGIRIHFPKTRQNDIAVIKPQFDFHVYNIQGTFSNLTNGVVVNVGIVKEVSIWVKGRNYPFTIALRMMDEKYKAHEYFFGNLFFDNWRKLTWINPNFIDNIKDRVLIRKPMYPKDIPHLRFKSIAVYRQMDQVGGDFVLYIKNLTMQYEKHAQTIKDPDIDDESTWDIMKKKALRNMKIEHKRLAERADLHRKEKKRFKSTK